VVKQKDQQLKPIHKSGLLLIPLLFAGLMGGQRWLATSPQALPSPAKSGAHAGVEAGVQMSAQALSLGSYYETAVSPVGSGQATANYRLWVPAGVSTIRGVIVKQHGCGDSAAVTGLDHASDLQWQVLAAKHQMALLGVRLPSGYPLCTDQAIGDRVTEQAFLKALSALGEVSSYPELERVPWIFWGHSGGADWGMQMLRHYPERVIAVVNMRCGGILNTSGQSEMLDLEPAVAATLLNVPVLWAVGANDPFRAECIDLPKQVFAKYRAANAAWTLAIEPNAQHESGNSRFLAIPYLDAILSLRLMPSGHLRPVDLAQGWLGNLEGFEVAASSQYQGNPQQAVWLPNQAIAAQWQTYVKTGQVLPTRPPAAPINVRVTDQGATKLVTWSFKPDLENGLPQFRIYRNRQLIKTFKGQEHQFDDTPNPLAVVLEFRDFNPFPNTTYRVSAFNAAGESSAEPAQASSDRLNRPETP
jgi:pimeloyl-ACP methyl ester carboxylesterase